jgi:hypothetical protein
MPGESKVARGIVRDDIGGLVSKRAAHTIIGLSINNIAYSLP